MPYIPKFSPLSLQEIAYAPSLMRAQHDQAVARNMELAEKLKFDYLSQDAEKLEPILKGYSENINKISSDLAKYGFTPNIREGIIQARQKYIQDDRLDKYKKNYKEAMEGWEEMKKASIQRGASGDVLNKFKKAYFGEYKGAFDDEGSYRQFTPGAVSGVYDIAEETKKAMTNIGKEGVVVGSSGSSIKFIPATAKLPAHYEVYDSKTGQLIKNANQIDAVKQYIKSEFDPSNKDSDRGLFSRLMEYDTDYINSLVDRVGTSMLDKYYQQLPQQDVSFQGFSGAAQKQNNQYDMSQYQQVSGTPDVKQGGDEKYRKLSLGFGADGNFNPENIKEDNISKFEEELVDISSTAKNIIGDFTDMFRNESKQQQDARYKSRSSSEELKKRALKTRTEASQTWNEMKAKYKTVYDYMKNNNVPDSKFAEFVAASELNETAKKDIKYGLDDPNALSYIFRKAVETGDDKTFIKIKKDGSEGDAISNDALQKKMNEDKVSTERQVLVDNYGTLTFKIGDEQFKVNKAVVPEQIKVDESTINDISKALYSYRMPTREWRRLANERWNIGNFVVRVDIDPNNPLKERRLLATDLSDELGLNNEYQFESPAQLQAYVSSLIYKGLANQPKIKK